MNIQAALGEQSLGLDGGGKPLSRSVVQRLRWFSHGEFHIHLDGVPLVCPDLCPVLAEGISLLFITPHDFIQNVPVDGVFPADARQQRKCYRKTRRMKQSFGLYFFPGKGVRVMACKYLDFQDRKKIAKMYQEEARVLDIAYKIGCHPATIYEELRRGDTGKLDKNQRPEYDPRLAQRTFQEAIRRRGNRRTTTTAESGQ